MPEQRERPVERSEHSIPVDTADVLHVANVHGKPELRSFDLPLLAQEIVRSLLAFTFVVILLVTIIFAFQKVGSPDWANTKELLQLLLPAETALLGSAVGFYFGSRRP